MEVGQNISTYPKSKKHTYYFVPSSKIEKLLKVDAKWKIIFMSGYLREFFLQRVVTVKSTAVIHIDKLRRMEQENGFLRDIRVN